MAAIVLRETFHQEANELQTVLRDAGSVRARSPLAASTRDSVVELVHLRIMALFETFVEDLFYDCLAGSSGLPEVVPKVSAQDPELLRDIVSSDGKFIALSRFSDLSKRSSMLMVASPFSRLDYRVQDRSALNEWIIVRNAVAHSSGPARQKFSELADRKRYPATRPADYLSSLLGNEREGEVAIARLRALSTALTSPSEVDADPHLLPQRDFSEKESPRSGMYLCKTCGQSKALSDGEKLGPCAQCGIPEACPTCGRAQGRNTSWVRSL